MTTTNATTAPQTIHGTVTLTDGTIRTARRIFNPRHGWSVLYDANLASHTYRTAPAAIADTFAPAECASCGVTGTTLVRRYGDIVCDDAGTCVDRRNAEIIDEAHAEALAMNAAARTCENCGHTGPAVGLDTRYTPAVPLCDDAHACDVRTGAVPAPDAD
jgi:hypothetical protein